jgi:dihydrofolate reductase
MTTLTYYAATTLDGFIADPVESLDWLFRQDQDHRGPLNYDDFFAGVGAMVMGSTTYRWILQHRDRAPEGAGEPWPYDVPAWVMTTRDLRAVKGADIRIRSGDVRDVYAEMAAVAAASAKDLWVVGGGDLAGQFADAGLLDEVVIYVAPVVLGEGSPLLPRRLDLELLESHRNRAFACARYRVVGPLREDAPGPPREVR